MIRIHHLHLNSTLPSIDLSLNHQLIHVLVHLILTKLYGIGTVIIILILQMRKLSPQKVSLPEITQSTIDRVWYRFRQTSSRLTAVQHHARLPLPNTCLYMVLTKSDTGFSRSPTLTLAKLLNHSYFLCLRVYDEDNSVPMLIAQLGGLWVLYVKYC